VIERELRKYSDNAEIHFTRLGITPEQIDEWQLPTRPTKTTDSRAKKFIGGSVEIDVIPAAQLKVMVNNVIVELVDPSAYSTVIAAEESERQFFDYFRDLHQRIIAPDDEDDEDDEGD
jgi:hypothetical protein